MKKFSGLMLFLGFILILQGCAIYPPYGRSGGYGGNNYGYQPYRSNGWGGHHGWGGGRGWNGGYYGSGGHHGWGGGHDRD